ncbi:spo0e like sporulation regulatory protein [Lucifera butyrica]|uniref:Spo0e like sporulation regulatory protein n=1 Tax=Lucifera butyrica TaxID=1351585 RepID=A0A498R1H6_9FIRM|nr:aspartyl-phosphate phosphatase Spo0E family protein [Lucifera butyrica]VBB05005.1 spo0e like sporulation regulatory protein [Lucifera butyrica]
MKSKEFIRAEIEKLRSKMHSVALLYGLSHPNVLKASRRLDKKINQYIKICQN